MNIAYIQLNEDSNDTGLGTLRLISGEPICDKVLEQINDPENTSIALDYDEFVLLRNTCKSIEFPCIIDRLIRIYCQ